MVLTGNVKDIYSPQAIRTSVGAIFNLQIVTLSDQETYEFLTSKEISIFGAALTDKALNYHKVNLSEASSGVAICMGTEADGLSSFWLEKSQNIIIPMRGISDSLNVSTASAILMYEATKNRT